MSTSRLHPLKQKQIQNLTSPQDTPLFIFGTNFYGVKRSNFFLRFVQMTVTISLF